MQKFKTIYADPCWNESGGGKIKWGADKHYPLMKTKDIIAMKSFVAKLCDEHCHLYLWVTKSILSGRNRTLFIW